MLCRRCTPLARSSEPFVWRKQQAVTMATISMYSKKEPAKIRRQVRNREKLREASKEASVLSRG